MTERTDHNEAMRLAQALKNRQEVEDDAADLLTQQAERIAELESELTEQARLLGMGAERELALMAERDQLRAEVESLRADAERLDHIEMHKLERSHCKDAERIREGLAAFSAYKKREDFAATPEPVGEPEGYTFVQPVPDKCDRIIWRGQYIHLPITRPAPGVPAKLPSAYATSTEDGTWRVLLAFDNKDDAEATRQFLHDHGVQPRTMRSSAPGVPEVLLANVIEALREGLSVCMSVTMSRDRKISRDGCTLYAQTDEWCRWLETEVGPQIRAALDALTAAQAKGGEA